MKKELNNLDKKTYSKTINKGKGDSKALKIEIAGLALNIASIAICTLALTSALTFRVPPEIIAVNDSGSYFEKVPLDTPNKDDEEMRQWVIDRVIEAFDYNFTNQAEHATSLAHHYTPEALSNLDSFINGQNANGKFVESMLKRRVNKEAGIVKFVLADGITLTSGKVRSLHGWQAKTKGTLVLYTKGGVIRLGRYGVTVVVIRADENENQDGLKIQSIQMEKLS
ncbi:DotI/IcmL/TraM family protein [Vibrio vulnificus]|nr:DotI/IcmL/TraM family protein [Vibrio vulnificus]